jgi:hypothetical protein
VVYVSDLKAQCGHVILTEAEESPSGWLLRRRFFDFAQNDRGFEIAFSTPQITIDSTLPLANENHAASLDYEGRPP